MGLQPRMSVPALSRHPSNPPTVPARSEQTGSGRAALVHGLGEAMTRRWSLPEPPPLDVRALIDFYGERWDRGQDNPALWLRFEDGYIMTWPALLTQGPLEEHRYGREPAAVSCPAPDCPGEHRLVVRT